MKKNMKCVAALVALASALSMGSCELLGNLFNKEPTVSLTISDGDSTPYNDEQIELTATAMDDDGDAITLSWYIDGAIEADLDSEMIYFTPSGYTSDKAIIISVVANDGNGKTAKDAITVTAKASSTLFVLNKSGSSLSLLKSRSVGGTSYSNDWLAGYELPTGYYYMFYGLADGEFEYSWLYGALSGAYSSVTLTKGKAMALTISGSTATSALVPVSSGSPGPRNALSSIRIDARGFKASR